MNPNTNYFAVGLFLLLGLASVVVLTVWLGQAADRTPTTQYVVRFQDDVNGLNNGSTVHYLGVKVGSVADIQLQTTGSPLVEVWIEIFETVPVDPTTFATLVVQGVTGIANIDLGSDPERARPLATHADGLKIIPFRATGLSAMLASSGDLSTDLQRLVAQATTWVDDENLSHLRSILDNVDQVTDSLAAERDAIPEVLASLRSAAAALEDTAQGLDNAIEEDWPIIAADLRATSGNLVSISTRVDGWLADNDAEVDRLLSEGLPAIKALVVDLETAAEELARLSRRLSEDPSRLVYRARHDPVEVAP